MTDMRHVIPALLAVFASTASAQFETRKIEIPDWENAVRFDVVASQSPVRPGDAFELAVVAEIEPGYHLYGPEEPEPTRTEVSLEPGALKPGKPLYPPVIRRELEGLGAYNLYEGSISVRIPVSLPANFEGKNVAALLEVGYQLCTDFACSAPTTKTLTASLNAAPAGAKVQKLHANIFEKKK
jgi:hypothetical protein